MPKISSSGEPRDRPEATFASDVDRGSTLGVSAADMLTAASGVSLSASGLPVVDRESYRVLGEFAKGGIGRILSARDPYLDRPVALKELLAGGVDVEERFVREALITARLQHPSIVPIYEAGRWPSGEPFYAMKFVSGRSLVNVIEESPSLDKRLALLPHVLAVAEAMAFAHSQRIIHRDLKPANILVGDFGETVVIDWGLAKILSAGDAREPEAREHRPEGHEEDPLATSSLAHAEPLDANAPPLDGLALTVAGSILGTPVYMPPEQARGLPVDERADVYALGAILYHVLAGDPPYEGTSVREVLMKVITEPPTALEQRLRGVPVDLLAIVKKAMTREVEGRYRTANELAEDLRRFQTGQIVRAHVYSLPERARRVARRYRAALLVAAVALVVLVGGATASITGILEAQKTAERKQVDAEASEKRATTRADDLTLAHARASLASDPNASLAWLKSLSPAFEGWGAARTIAADAVWRGLAKVFREHSAAAGDIAFSPDGALLVSVGDDRKVLLRDLRTGETRALLEHADEAWCAAFSPDGELLATGGKDKLVRLRNLSTGEERALKGHDAGVAYLSFSPDGSLLVTRGEFEKVWLWTVATGAGRVISRTNGYGPAVFSPDSTIVAFADEGGLTQLIISSGERIRSPELSTDRLQIAFSPDGARIAAAGTDASVRLWSAANGAPELLYSHAFGRVAGVAFSARGEHVISSGQDGAVKIWDVAAGTLQTLKGRVGYIERMVVSRDATMLATTGGNSIELWDIATGESRVFRGFADDVTHVAISPRGDKMVGSSTDGTVRLWSLPHSPHVAAHGTIEWAAFSPDGTRAVTLGKDGLLRMTTLSPHRRDPIGDVNGSVPSPASETVLLNSPATKPSTLPPGIGFEPGLKISPNNEQVAAVYDDGTVRVIPVAGGEPLVLRGHQGQAYTVDFASSGGLLASGGTDGTVRLWDISEGDGTSREGKVLFRHGAEVTSLMFSPDGRALASGAVDGSLRVLDPTTSDGKDLRGHTGAVLALAFSPDGAILISGGQDRTIRLWDRKSGQNIVRETAGVGYIRRFAFLQDGKSFASLIGDSSVWLWDARTGESRGALRGHTGTVMELSVSPDGRRVATGSMDRTVRLWDLASGESRTLPVTTGSLVDFSSDGLSVASIGFDGTVNRWADDMPTDPAGLRAWLAAATPETIDARPSKGLQ